MGQIKEYIMSDAVGILLIVSVLALAASTFVAWAFGQFFEKLESDE